MTERHQTKQAASFKDRLKSFAEQARAEAQCKSGLERDELLRKARQADIAAHLDDWVNSPSLQPPD